MNLSELIELARILERERPHERGTRHREHRCHSGDPKRHRANGYRRERRRATQAANAVTDVLRNRIHQRHRGVPTVRASRECVSTLPVAMADLAPLLTARARVLGVTPRGCGRSGEAADGYGIDQQIRELIGFMDALGLERATFAGHSSGGGKVVRLARLFPSRVTAVVAFDIGYSKVPDDFEAKMQAAIDAKTPVRDGVSLESFRAGFQAWELAAWSRVSSRSRRKSRRQAAAATGGAPPGWQNAFIADMQAGWYAPSRLRIAGAPRSTQRTSVSADVRGTCSRT